MPEDDLRDLLCALNDLLRPHLERSEALRRLLLHAGRWLIEHAKEADKTGDLVSVAADTHTPESQVARGETFELERHDAPVDAAATESPDCIIAEVPLRLGDDEQPITVTGTPEGIQRARLAAAENRGDDTDFAIEEAEPALDLSLIAQRCRLKAKACRIFIERRRIAGDLLAERPLIDQIDEMIAEAKAQPRCFLWMLYREREQPDDAVLAMIAECYEALAEAASALQVVEALSDGAREDDVDEAFQLFAEAHSALRIALLEGTWLTMADRDQEEAHAWLRRETVARRLYVPRYMKLDDPADPSAAGAVRKRAADLLRQLREHQSRLKQIETTFKRLRYHLDLLDGDDDADRHHYRRIAEAVDSLIDLGVPPSDPRFRPLFAGIRMASFPEEIMSPGTSRVFSALDEWRRNQDAPNDAMSARNDLAWSDRVAEVRCLLSGGAIVMIGGEPRIEHIQRIKEVFDLAEVHWPQLTEHGTGQPMRAPIFRSNTRLVILLAKLAGHLHMDEAVQCAKDARKPYIILKAGYSPEQIAEHVLEQASEQLRAAESASL